MYGISGCSNDVIDIISGNTVSSINSGGSSSDIRGGSSVTVSDCSADSSTGGNSGNSFDIKAISGVINSSKSVS